MSHLSSSPPKHKGEHKGHSLPRGSERWVGLGAGGFREEVPEGRVGWGGAGDPWPDPPARAGVAPPGTRTAVCPSAVQCPCPLEGRAAAPTAPSPRPRRSPIASSVRSHRTSCNMPTTPWTGECLSHALSGQPAHSASSALGEPVTPSPPHPPALGTLGDRKPSTRPGKKTSPFSFQVMQLPPWGWGQAEGWWTGGGHLPENQRSGFLQSSWALLAGTPPSSHWSPRWRPGPIAVGYSTCHWCHMMEEESFRNEEIGRLLNEDFVSVKVDREERPDVDKVYMTFVQVGGHPPWGGWHMHGGGRPPHPGPLSTRPPAVVGAGP